MNQRGVRVVVVNVDAQEVHVDRVFLPHAVKQHHHADVIVYDDGNVRVLEDGNPHAENTQWRPQ